MNNPNPTGHGMTSGTLSSGELAAHIEAGPSIAEQREIRIHNAPVIAALSIAVLQAQRLFGRDSAEHQAACRLFDTASEKAKQQERL